MSNTYSEFVSSGITANTPTNIMIGAGTIHKGLVFTPTTYALTEDTSFNALKTYYTKSGDVYEEATVTAGESVTASTYYEASGGTWNVEASLIAATSGGTKVSIVPEVMNVEVDGALVKVKDLAVKIGEVATIETNIVEIKPDFIKSTIIGKEGTSTVAGYNVIESNNKINTGDYIENFGYIGQKADKTPIIIIFDYALCTSGFEIEGKNKESAVTKATFECYANLSSAADTLPYHIYYPTPATS